MDPFRSHFHSQLTKGKSSLQKGNPLPPTMENGRNILNMTWSSASPNRAPTELGLCPCMIKVINLAKMTAVFKPWMQSVSLMCRAILSNVVFLMVLRSLMKAGLMLARSVKVRKARTRSLPASCGASPHDRVCLTPAPRPNAAKQLG